MDGSAEEREMMRFVKALFNHAVENKALISIVPIEVKLERMRHGDNG